MHLALLFLIAATLRGPADVTTLTAASDAVVHARVVRSQSAWGAGGPQSGVIYTRVTLAPIEWWKGAAQAEITVRVPGGAVGEIDQLVQGVAKFGEGEEVVVFLRRLAPGLFDVERWALGKFSVKSGAASRDRSGLTCVGCREGEEDQLPVSALRARVRGSLRQ
jgi:hypothetical protein